MGIMLLSLIDSFCDCFSVTVICVDACGPEEAFEESQKYKEGKFILEKEKLIKEALA